MVKIMPEKFDFSKIEDQQKFEGLPQEEKDKVVGEAQEEAEVENLEKELSPEIIEKIMEKVEDINKRGTAFSVISPEYPTPKLESGESKLGSILKNGLVGTSPKQPGMTS